MRCESFFDSLLFDEKERKREREKTHRRPQRPEESPDPFRRHHRPHAVDDAAVRGTHHLQPLLDDVGGRHQGVGSERRDGAGRRRAGRRRRGRRALASLLAALTFPAPSELRESLLRRLVRSKVQRMRGASASGDRPDPGIQPPGPFPPQDAAQRPGHRAELLAGASRRAAELLPRVPQGLHPRLDRVDGEHGDVLCDARRRPGEHVLLWRRGGERGRKREREGERGREGERASRG